MRNILTITICLIVAVILVTPSIAETNAVTLTGKITCAKCELKIEKNCATVIVVKEGGKDVLYYFDQKAHKENHEAICATGKAGTVTGTVSEKDGKKYVAVSKVTFTK